VAEVKVIEYDLYVVPLNGFVNFLKTYPDKDSGIIAFDHVVKTGKMRAAFLDERTQFDNDSRSAINVKKWRKRANKTKGQSR
jgi:hypothetical protein